MKSLKKLKKQIFLFSLYINFFDILFCIIVELRSESYFRIQRFVIPFKLSMNTV